MAVTRDELRSWLDRQDLTLEELVRHANALLQQVAPTQTRYKVTDRPDARAIRYYIAQDLLPKPVSYEGGRARYAGGHLLRLLLVKRLQMEHHRLQRIALVLGGLSDEQVLQALLTPGPVADPEHPGPPGLRPPLPQGEVRPRLDLAPPTGGDRGRTGEGIAGTTLIEPPPSGTRRLELVPGGAIDVPESVLRDAAQRRRLADNLEVLAQWLRASCSDPPNAAKDTPHLDDETTPLGGR